MNAIFQLSKRSIDQLESDIISLAEQVNAKEYEFLVAVREFDLRQGWKPYLFNHCSEWLSMKCGIDIGTGREKIRVAHALFDLPEMSAAFEAGELSYSKARALTRVATPTTESDLLTFAAKANAEQVQKHCQRIRNSDRSASTRDANHIHRKRYLSRSIDHNGRMKISVELPAETGELVMLAVERVMEELEKQPSDPEVESYPEITREDSDKSTPHSDEESFQAKQADALVEIATAYLAGGKGVTGSRSDRYQITVHVDERALRDGLENQTDDRDHPSRDGSAPKSDFPIETIRRLCCDGSVTAITEDEKGNPLNVGRKHRIAHPKLRKALASRDKCCSYPGCHHDKWLDAHH